MGILLGVEGGKIVFDMLIFQAVNKGNASNRKHIHSAWVALNCSESVLLLASVGRMRKNMPANQNNNSFTCPFLATVP